MKKMGYTKYESINLLSLIGRSTFLILFALCFISLQNAEAQADPIVHPIGVKGETVKYKIDKCDGANIQYTDDNNNDDGLLYADYAVDSRGRVTTGGRTDTVEICPENRWHYVNVTFTEFDIHEDDMLEVYDGSYDSLVSPIPANVPAQVTGSPLSGHGVSNANGGWVSANCDLDVNPTGCLTFVFKTNADNKKGLGWDAWVTCANRDIEVEVASITSKKIECDDDVTNDGFADITIAKPTVEASCGDIDPRVTLTVKAANGTTLHTKTGLLSALAADSILTDFAVGSYVAEWSLAGDPSKTTGPQIFSVSLPALVCNDEVVIPLGAACAIGISVDDILENPCDTSESEFVAYNIGIKFGSGRGVIYTGSGSGLGGATSSNDLPIITKELLKEAAEMSGTDLAICNSTAEVTIDRIYTPVGTDFNNGIQRTSCTTIISFKDEVAPIATVALTDAGGNAIDTLIACDTESLKSLIKIGAIDNCDIKDTTVSITLEKTDPCFASEGMFGADTTRAFVTVTATDFCGNIGRTRDTFIILRPQTFADPKDGEFECSESGKATQLPGLRVGYVDSNGDDIITDTIYKLSEIDYYCGYILISESIGDIPDTDCGTKDYIEWSILDWCSPETGVSVIDTQFITYTDNVAPYIIDTVEAAQAKIFDLDDEVKSVPAINVELDHFSCTYDINKITEPRAGDDCDANPSVSIDAIFRIEDGALWEITSGWETLDCDSFLVKWIAEDKCHDQTDTDAAYQVVEIKDVTKPSAACTDQLNISISNESGARICADDVDAGSYDACGIKSKLIRIKGKDKPFTECIDIGCEFVHLDLQIEMQVTDNKDNVNICWLDVVVEDKINPHCNPLDDVTEDCDEFHNGELGDATDVYLPLEGSLKDFYDINFGDPTRNLCEDNLNAAECGELTYEQEYKLTVWPCGEQVAYRRYRAIDWSENKSSWVEQKITITYKADWKITFPADWSGDCGELAPAEEIVISNGACDLLGYEVTEKQFDTPGDVCFKIERTYHVINWCKYEAGQDPVELSRVEGDHGVAEGLMITSEGIEEEGYWTYTQVLRVQDDVAPVVTVIDPEPCIDGVEFDAEPYGEEDNTPGSAPFECDEEKTWSATAVDCSSNITWEGKLYNKATGEEVATSNTNEITYIVSNKETYYAEFWAYDNCGNSAGERGEDVKFWDCKKPTPYVLNGIAVDLGETGTIEVWAIDLNQNSFDNCSDQSKLEFRIWADFLGDAPEGTGKGDADASGVSDLREVIEFDCDRVGTNVIYIYVIDEEGNWDFAQTYAIVQDNMNVCENDQQDGMVTGRIVNPNGENVEAVTITVTGGAEQSMTTGTDGAFQFALANGADYTVTPVKDINPLNGVSTFDLVLISKHILGITQFDSPYKYVAADVNKSGSITAFDMVQLRQLILNITTEFASNDSWRFVDASHQFTSANPASENFNEFYSINALNGNMVDMDFVGVKIGDVNGNAQANNLLGADSRTTNGALTLTTADRFVEAGETVTVAFTAADIANAQGYQFTMNVAGQNAEIVEGVAKADNFNTNLADRGVITTSWNGEATTNDELFAVTFNATASGLLSELVTVNSDITTAEAYNTAGELMDVNINFTSTAAAGFTLAQNTPNPFKGETVIGFNLPAAGTATLTVMDVQGKVLKSIKADYAKGANQVSLNASELNATGVLYYQLESADNVATKKMIIIE